MKSCQILFLGYWFSALTLTPEPIISKLIGCYNLHLKYENSPQKNSNFKRFTAYADNYVQENCVPTLTSRHLRPDFCIQRLFRPATVASPDLRVPRQLRPRAISVRVPKENINCTCMSIHEIIHLNCNAQVSGRNCPGRNSRRTQKSGRNCRRTQWSQIFLLEANSRHFNNRIRLGLNYTFMKCCHFSLQKLVPFTEN